MARLGEMIRHADRRTGPDLSLDEPLGFQLAETLGQQPVGEAWNGVHELVEAPRAAHQHAHDRSRPAPADQLDGAMEARAKTGQWLARLCAGRPRLRRARLAPSGRPARCRRAPTYF